MMIFSTVFDNYQIYSPGGTCCPANQVVLPALPTGDAVVATKITKYRITDVIVFSIDNPVTA